MERKEKKEIEKYECKRRIRKDFFVRCLDLTFGRILDETTVVPNYRW